MEIDVKRVSKFTVKKSHKLFNYCDATAFGSKNLFNLANYYIRQCFIFKGKDNPTKEQIALIEDINIAIDDFNKKSAISFEKNKPENIAKLENKIKNFKENNNCDTKNNKERLQDLKLKLSKLKDFDYDPQKYVSKENGLVNYNFLDYYFSKHLKTKDNPYKLLPAAASQQVLRYLFKDWKSFFTSIKDYNKNPSKYTGRPKLPKYKDKNGRHKISFTNQSCKIRNGVMIFPKTELTLNLGIDTKNCVLKEVRIKPMGSTYKIEAVWDKTFTLNEKLDFDKYIGIDLGLKNFATIINNIGLKPIIVNGKPLVAINQYYNKTKARLQRKLPFKMISYFDKKENAKVTKKVQCSYSKQIDTLTRKRTNKIEDFMYKSSGYIIKYCLEHNIGNIVIGKNTGWKVSVNIGKRNNQNFVNIPFTRFIKILTYKAEEYGIVINLIQEDYTSKSSFLDLDPLPFYKKGATHSFSGKRIKRGLYKTGNVIINADVNGAYNILRRFNSELFTAENIKAIKYIPYRVNISGYIAKKKPA